MKLLRGLASAAALLLWAQATHAANACTLSKRAEMPVTMNSMRPMLHATINGTDAPFFVDSGAFYSMMPPAAADQFRLPRYMAPFGMIIQGVGGMAANVSVTKVHSFGIFGVTFSDVEFLVAGNDFGQAKGLIGQNILRLAGDVEYDLGNGVVRLMTAHDCGKANLAYWATGQPVSVLDIDIVSRESPHTRGIAYLNGQKISVMFDTGAALSLLSLGAAKRAGITPSSPNVVSGGFASGVGTRVTQSWIARFDSFKIGDEEIRHARLRFSELDIRGTDMLLGPDFFLSHRIYVSNSQHKLYFTYNGGPVFDLTASRGGGAADEKQNPTPPAGAGAGDTSSTDAAGGTSATQPDANPQPPASAAGDSRDDRPADASGFSRRGAAFAARRDYTHAIADFTRACELAPTEASYFYQRAVAYSDNGQPEPAVADLDEALKLQPNYLPALLARAELHLRKHERAEATPDIDAATRVAGRGDAVQLQLGHMYMRADLPARADERYSAWIAAHSRADINMPHALAARCRARALSATIPSGALGDCDDALRRLPQDGATLTARGLVRLRQGDYDKALADLDRAVQINPRDSFALYGRGVAKLRKGRTSDAQADLEQAKTQYPKVAEALSTIGITP